MLGFYIQAGSFLQLRFVDRGALGIAQKADAGVTPQNFEIKTLHSSCHLPTRLQPKAAVKSEARIEKDPRTIYYTTIETT